MPKTITLALALVAFGTLSGVAVLLKTTALTLGFFAGVGIPCFLVAAGLYSYEVLRDLKRHDVI